MTTHWNPCGTCRGSGKLPLTITVVVVTCPTCDGRGHFGVRIVRSTATGGNDCTAMADAAIEQKRETGKRPWED